MDVYSSYNQIHMYQSDFAKKTSMIKNDIYCYKVMFFSLKNISNTYTQIMNKFLIRDMLEDYLDDVIIKYEEDIDRRTHFEEVFKEV
jgi:hypothetical protein